MFKLFKKLKKENWKKKITIYFPYFLSLFVYLFVRFFIVNTPTRAGYLADSLYFTFLTMTKAIIKYVSLSILPLNLSVNHIISQGILALNYGENQNQAILAQSFFDASILFSLIIISLLIFLAFKSWKKFPFISFSLGWFFIALLPVLNIFPNPVIMTEKYAYLASFAACFLLSFLLFKLYHLKLYQPPKKTKSPNYLKVLIIILFIIIASFYLIQTINRNQDWYNDATLWAKLLQQAPNSAAAHTNLAGLYFRENKHDLALFHTKRALNLNPSFLMLYDLLGEIYLKRKEYGAALEQYKKNLELKPHTPTPYLQLANIYFLKKEYNNSIKYYQKAVALNPDIVIAHYRLGNIHFLKQDYFSALKEYKKVLELKKDHAPAYKTVGAILIFKEKYPSAIKFLEKSLELNPYNANAWESLGVAYFHLNQTKEAISAWQKSLELEDNEEIRKNLRLLKNKFVNNPVSS